MPRRNVTPECHAGMSRRYVTPVCHAGMSRRYVTPVCHAGMSRRYVTPECHAGMSRRYVTPVCHAGMSRRYVTPVCHAGMPRAGMPECRAGMSRRYVTPVCHAGMSRRYVTPVCHAGMSRRYVTPVCRAGINSRAITWRPYRTQTPCPDIAPLHGFGPKMTPRAGTADLSPRGLQDAGSITCIRPQNDAKPHHCPVGTLEKWEFTPRAGTADSSPRAGTADLSPRGLRVRPREAEPKIAVAPIGPACTRTGTLTGNAPGVVVSRTRPATRGCRPC